MERLDQRSPDELRYHRMIPDYVRTAAGSCLIETGGTRVICTASVEEGVPPFLKGKGMGWLTAEYAMLPASTGRRKSRDGIKKDGRGVEISRLIGRALRQAVDRRMMAGYTITIDCDVLEADGGTRTASITGGFVALVCAVDRMIRKGMIRESPVRRQIAAVSAGVVDGECCLDLCYDEDSSAQTDMNFVMDDTGAFIELQGTGEGRPFTRSEMEQLTDLGEKGCMELMEEQRRALGDRKELISPPRVLVMATPLTVQGSKFHRLLDQYRDWGEITALPCPGLMEYVEKGELSGPGVRSCLEKLLKPCLERGVDAIVLGCTHYPFVRPLIREIAGENVQILDGGEGTARELQRRLAEMDLLTDRKEKGEIVYMESLPERIPLCRELMKMKRRPAAFIK